MSSNEVRECPLPSRRSVHAAVSPVGTPEITRRRSDLHEHPQRNRKTTIGILSGVGVGALTLAVPLTGFASSLQMSGSGEGEKVLASFDVQSEWIGDDAQSGTIVAASALDEVQAATSRAKLRTPVEVSRCVVGTQPANGDRSVIQQESVYWPLYEGTYQITSGFSWRVNPVSGETLMHEGDDMAAPLGTPIYAAADGVVTEIGSNDRSGNYVTITHHLGDGTVYTTTYMHQYTEDILVQQGQTVTAGQQIGAVGNAGWSTGPHLHFEIRDASDNPVDPELWMPEHGAIFLGQDCG